jgi:hypothetical protein
VDGQRIYSNNNVSTLLTNTDGAVDQLGFGLYIYQLRDSVNPSSTDFRSAYAGPSAASIGFTP